MPKTGPAAGPALLSEQDLISRFLEPLTKGAPEALGLADDAALVPVGDGEELVITSDALAAGRHFAADDPAEDIGFKTLAVNVSDLIAKGANPYLYFLTMALPGVDPSWLAAFTRGLAEAQSTFGCRLAGGDTIKSDGALTLSITAIGKLEAGSMVRRAGAMPGDIVFASGTIGDAALGLDVVTKSKRVKSWDLDKAQCAYLVSRLRRPEVRVALAPVLRRWARAAMDISDGLLGDLESLCRTSGVGAEIVAEDIPLSAAAGRALEHDRLALEKIVAGGDDYEILAVTAPERAEDFESAAQATGNSMARIGEIKPVEHGIRVCDSAGRPLEFVQSKFDHFAARSAD